MPSAMAGLHQRRDARNPAPPLYRMKTAKIAISSRSHRPALLQIDQLLDEQLDYFRGLYRKSWRISHRRRTHVRAPNFLRAGIVYVILPDITSPLSTPGTAAFSRDILLLPWFGCRLFRWPGQPHQLVQLSSTSLTGSIRLADHSLILVTLRQQGVERTLMQRFGIRLTVEIPTAPRSAAKVLDGELA